MLVLDEPTTGLDPQARLRMGETIRSYRDRGRTVLLTTHYMEEAQRQCDRVAVIDRGKVIALGPPTELVRSLGGDLVVELALSEGEDFELLFTMAPERFRRLASRWPHEAAVTAIGEIVASGFTIVEAGLERKARPLGFQHR